MPSQIVEPAELEELLGSVHVHLRDVEQHILAARCRGGSNADLAPALGYSPDSLRRMFERVEDVILRPIGLERNLAYTIQWFNQHLDCEKHCLAHAKMLIRERRVYDVPCGVAILRAN